MSETKQIQLKLICSNPKFFKRRLFECSKQGWELEEKGTRFSHIAYLTKTVFIDSTEPEFSTDNCKPLVDAIEETPSLDIQEQEETELGALQELTEASTEVTQDNIELQPEYDSPELLFDLQKGELVDSLPNEEVENPQEASTNIDKDFEKRPYTEEELLTWPWPTVTRLAAILGVGSGKKEQRISGIVSQSVLKWSTADGV